MKKDIYFHIKKIILLSVSQYLLNMDSVSGVLKDVRKGMIFYISAATFSVAAVLFIFFEIYSLMITSGVSHLYSILILAALLLLSAMFCVMFAHFFVERAKKKTSPGRLRAVQKNQFEEITKSFLEGLFDY